MDERAFPSVDGVSHHFAEAGEIRMHYAEAGPRDGEPVVLLHGWPQHWYCWRRVIPTLAGRFRVIAPDLRGFGWSDAPDSTYEKEELAGDVLALLEALDLRDVRLVGHDWGGFAGFLACLRDPSRIRSYLALGINHPWSNRVFNPQSVIAAAAYQPLISTPLIGPLAQRYTPFLRAVFAVSGGGRIWDAIAVETFSAQFRDPERARAASRLYRVFLTKEVREMGRYRDRRLTVPTRLVVGESDPVISRALVAGGEAHGDDFTIEFVPGGHFLPEQRPELVAPRLP